MKYDSVCIYKPRSCCVCEILLFLRSQYNNITNSSSYSNFFQVNFYTLHDNCMHGENS